MISVRLGLSAELRHGPRVAHWQSGMCEWVSCRGEVRERARERAREVALQRGLYMAGRDRSSQDGARRVKKDGWDGEEEREKGEGSKTPTAVRTSILL